MSKKGDEHRRHQSSTVPAVVFSSAFQNSLSPPPPQLGHAAASDDDDSYVQSLHIAVDDDLTPQSSPLPDDSPDSTVPQFHYDPDDLSPLDEDSTSHRSHSLSHPSEPTITTEPQQPIPHTEIVLKPVTAAPRYQSVVSTSTTASPVVALTSPVGLAASFSSPPATSHSHPSAIPIHSTTGRPSVDAKTTCRVVGCTEKAERANYCLPHHKLFVTDNQPAEESNDVRVKREKKERKVREQQLALLREKSSTMPASSTLPNISTHHTAASSSNTLSTASHPHSHSSSSPQPSASSPTTSPGWFSRPSRKSSSEGKESRGTAGSVESDADDSGVVGDALLVETRRAWRMANKVVSKDVPRLAKRMSVIDDKRVCVLWGRTVQAEEVDRATKPRPSVSVSLSQQEALAEEVAAAMLQEQQAQDESKQATAADPPSPKSRVKGKEVVESELPEISTWQAITNVVLAVAEHLESSDTLARTRDHFHRIALTLTPHSDLEAPLSDVLNDTLGLASPTFAVFRATHQSILFPAVYSLKTQLYSQVGAMKDVRRHDGWQVEIYIGEGRVWITHVRREQSMEAAESVTHFEVEWEIRLSFDRGMEDCRAVFLRIQDINFHPLMPRDRKEQIVSVMRGAGYIV